MTCGTVAKCMIDQATLVYCMKIEKCLRARQTDVFHEFGLLLTCDLVTFIYPVIGTTDARVACFSVFTRPFSN